jgi:hypothetical protein
MFIGKITGSVSGNRRFKKQRLTEASVFYIIVNKVKLRLILFYFLKK